MQREVLTRYYLHEQPTNLIRKDLRLDETEVRLMKSRAKAMLQSATVLKGGLIVRLTRTFVGSAF